MDEQMERGGAFEESAGLPSAQDPAGGVNSGEPSQEQPDTPISEPVAATADREKLSSFQDQLDELNAHIEEVIEKKFKSGKDRRLMRLELEVNALNKQLTDLLEQPEKPADENPAGGQVARASQVIQPSGGGLPAPDLRGEYEKRLADLRFGDIAGLMELKREFRKRGLEVY